VCEVPPVEIVLEKRLPVAAGLGGGSSDAAATLLGVIELFDLDIDDETLNAVAAEVGSDVPLFLVDSPALMEGRGESVTPLAPWSGEPLGLLLITAGLPLRTPEVFAAFAAGLRGSAQGAALVSSQHLAAELTVGFSGLPPLRRRTTFWPLPGRWRRGSAPSITPFAASLIAHSRSQVRGQPSSSSILPSERQRRGQP
jgi:hypothetical protein